MNLPPPRDPNAQPVLMAEVQDRVDHCSRMLRDAIELATDHTPANQARVTMWQHKLENALRELAEAREWLERHRQAQADHARA